MCFRFAFLLLFGFTLQAQMLEDYVQARINELVEVRLAKKKTGTQTEPISLSRGSTDFVDQTSAADLASVALGLAGVGRRQETANTQVVTATATLYAIYAGARRMDPLEPQFYRDHARLRRLSLALGQEEGVADKPDIKSRASLFGVKVLLINTRDVTDLVKDREQMEKLKSTLALQGSTKSLVQRRVIEFLVARLAPSASDEELRKFRSEVSDNVKPKIDQLTPADKEELDRIFQGAIHGIVQARQVIDEVYEVFQRKPQLSLEYQTAQRPNQEADIHRGQFIFDVGLPQRWSVTVNAGYEYTDVKRLGADLRGGRVAGELKTRLSDSGGLALRQPVTVSLAGEGKWLNNTDANYRAQLKLTLPLSNGVDLPVSFGYASRRDLLNETGIYGKFGLTFDFAKLLDTLK